MPNPDDSDERDVRRLTIHDLRSHVERELRGNPFLVLDSPRVDWRETALHATSDGEKRAPGEATPKAVVVVDVGYPEAALSLITTGVSTLIGYSSGAEVIDVTGSAAISTAGQDLVAAVTANADHLRRVDATPAAGEGVINIYLAQNETVLGISAAVSEISEGHVLTPVFRSAMALLNAVRHYLSRSA